MNRYSASIVILLLLAAVIAFIFFVPPLHQVRYGVSIRQRGYQANGVGVAVPLFAVSNGGPREVLVTPGRQISPASFDMLGSLPQTLAPGQEALLTVPASTNAAFGRMFIHCQAAAPSSKAVRLFTGLLLKQKVVERVYAEEGAK